MNIIQKFITNNENYQTKKQITPKGLMLHSVGTAQPSAEVFFKIYNSPRPNGQQVGVHAFVDASGQVLQTLPWNWRAWHSGGSANDTHIGVEMTEPGTISYIGGSGFTDHDPEKTREFVKGTYVTATDLFAYLCKEYKLDPLADGVIISHSEGYKRGIASNHGDVEHIWNKYGLTMQQFRLDVQTKMQQQGPAEWAKEAWAWAIKNGLTDGTRPQDFATRQEIITLLYRFSSLK